MVNLTANHAPQTVTDYTTFSSFEFSPAGRSDCTLRVFSLKYLNFLLDYLADIEIIAYLCIVKIIRGARSSSPIKMKAAYFVPYAKRTIAATA